jgi:hypothetical protein
VSKWIFDGIDTRHFLRRLKDALQAYEKNTGAAPLRAGSV